MENIRLKNIDMFKVQAHRVNKTPCIRAEISDVIELYEIEGSPGTNAVKIEQTEQENSVRICTVRNKFNRSQKQ